MCGPDSWQPHAEYHINFKHLMAKFLSYLRVFLWDRYTKERQILMSLNLDPVGEYLSQYYSSFGRPSKNQVQILCSFLLFTLLFNCTDAKLSLTAWVEDVLPNDPVLFALIGCPILDSLPPPGSYFDFMDHSMGVIVAAAGQKSVLPLPWLSLLP